MNEISSVNIVTIILILINIVQVHSKDCNSHCFKQKQVNTGYTIVKIHSSFRSDMNILNIKLNSSEINSLENTTFHGLWRIKELYLQDNIIENLPHELFSNLTALKTLNISNNKIAELNPRLFGYLVNLQELYMNDNKIERIDNHLFVNNTILKKLYLSRNKITYLTKDTFDNNIEIAILNFAGNQITTIENSTFAKLINLYSLDLYNNNITNLEKGTFDTNTKLTELHLQNNKLSAIEDGIFTSLINLKMITLSNNYIKHISNLAFPKTIDFTFVSLAINQLEYLDATIFNSSTNLLLLLNNNPWNCNCKLKNLIRLSQKTTKSDAFCTKPRQLKSIAFKNLTTNFITIDILSKEVHMNDGYITLNCEICNEAEAQINWLYNGVIIKQENQKYRITNLPLNDTIVSTNLTIYGSDKNDNGTYTCRVTHPMDIQENEFYISLIQAKPTTCDTWIIWMINLVIFGVLIIFVTIVFIYLRRKTLQVSKNKKGESQDMFNQENDLYMTRRA